MLNIKQINTKITDQVFLGSFDIEIMENRWFVVKKVYSVQICSDINHTQWHQRRITIRVKPTIK